MPAPGAFTPTDDLIGPIITQLAQCIQTQITPAPSVVYTMPPDGQPENNSVALGMAEWKVEEGDLSTNGILSLCLTFNVWHFFQSRILAENIQNTYNWLHAYLNVFSAWGNQYLQDSQGVVHARAVCPKKGGTTKASFSGIPFTVLYMQIEVITDFSIPLT
jgi:hypothetical protein